MRSKKYVIPAVLILLIIIISAALFQISKSRNFQFFGTLIASVETNQKVVALTFDDSPTEFSDEVVALLKQKKIKATFYSIGSKLEKFPEEGKRIVEHGHEMGNHSYSHERFLFKSNAFIDQEIQQTDLLIREANYKGEITFRPPYGKKLLGLPWYLQQHNIKTIMWDVEPDTYIDKGLSEKQKTEFIVTYVIENTKPGSIILLHPFCQECEADRKAIPLIIDALQNKGFKFVTVSELLKYKDK